MRNLLSLIILIFSMCMLDLNSAAQNVHVPQNYSLETSSDYRANAPAVKKCLEWLLETPLHEFPDKRDEVNAFVMLWLTGTPTLTVETKSSLMPFIEKNEELFYTFVHALSLYHIKNREVEKHADVEFALSEVIRMYRKSKGLSKDDEMKELRRARRWGNLDEWIEARI